MIENPRIKPESDQQQVLYIGKHGSDTSDGETPDRAFLTFGAAMAAAGTPADEAHAVTVICLDDGDYTEDIVGTAYVNIYASHAHIIGDHALGPNQSWTIRHAESSTTDTIFDRTQAGVGGTIVNVDRLTLSGGGVGPIWGFNCQSDRMIAHVNHVYMSGMALLAGAIGMGHELTIDVGHVRMEAGADMCIGFYPLSGAKIITKAGWLEGDANSTAFLVTDGEVDAVVSRLTAGTAYDVRSGSALRLVCAELVGAETIADGADVRVSKARRDNYTAAGAPGVGDDADDGYTVGSVWINVTADDAYVCCDSTAGAAVWKKTTP